MEGRGESEDSLVRITVSGGRMTDITIDPRSMRRSSVELADDIRVAMNAALEAHATALMHAMREEAPTREPTHPARRGGGRGEAHAHGLSRPDDRDDGVDRRPGGPMSDIVFSPESYRRAGGIIEEATRFIKDEIDRLLDSVTDFQLLGTNDIVGRLANELYRAFIEAFRQIVHGLVDGLLDQSETLRMVGDLYRDTSEAATSLASLIGKDY
ncbi:YbaB/EbfC family nucleoid-associated protein [Tessaracoccus coleopterorum]|uniref:YbaB/EbfC family nucleoid-associated protein n=1 Tax=Tessaracoccus coleopterorum TaxID=2714950 RepID=UPI0038CD27F8